MKDKKKIPAPITTEQDKRKFSELTQKFLKSGFFKSEVLVKPESLSDLYGCKNAKN